MPPKTVILTARQKEVVRLRALGETFPSIALTIGISPKTAEYHWAKACLRIGVNDPIKMVHYALRARLIKNLFGDDHFRIHILQELPLGLADAGGVTLRT